MGNIILIIARIKNYIHNLRRKRWYIVGRLKIRSQINSLSKTKNLKIIIGSGGKDQKDWISTDLPHFNILKKSDWKFFFNDRKINNLLAEHVLEHLSEEEVNVSLQNAYSYLIKDGNFRIAVPDSMNPDPKYIAMTKPPIDGHKSFWNYKTLSELAKKNGFQVSLLEYYNEHKKFTLLDYTNENGKILRCKLNNYYLKTINEYTSLVIDLKK